MNRHVNSIAGRLSLRPPQRESLEILDRVTEIVPPHRKYSESASLQNALEIIRSEYSGVTDFEREFPSLCFALATGVGKTRLMGAFIAYLHLAHGLNNFFVMAPNLTIYNKLITDFTPNTPKYVFKGIAEFALNAPEVITGENYEQRAGGFAELFGARINIFNISKINSEVRGGKAPRIKRLSEYIGESYFDYLAGLDDLVLLMDESHRYRASAGVRAINELRPVLGLELTATPFVETSKGPVPFKNVIYDYALGRAMADGFVKEPAVVTRKDFNPTGMSADEIERLKLEDGIRLHEGVKVELETYARETAQPIVKPFVLVIARDTTHAAQLLQLIESDEFFGGRYRGKAIQVDSSQTGAAEERMIESLLKVEHTDEPTEIVIHVNMLKEGWDVTNLYTIVPLRAANARILIEQSIGRGLRLPYGKRVGVTAVDRLNIVAHDKFQEIIEEANRPDSMIHLQQVVLDDETLNAKTQTVVAQSQIEAQLGVPSPNPLPRTPAAATPAPPVFVTPQEQKIAQTAYAVMRDLGRRGDLIKTAADLQKPEVQRAIVAEVESRLQPEQLQLEGTASTPDIAAIVGKTGEVTFRGTIDIPRISLVPKDGQNAEGRFQPFKLDLGGVKYETPSNDLFAKLLRTGETQTIGLGSGGIEEARLEDYVVAGLVDFDDVSYDDHADLLYNLAGQVVRHLTGYLSEEDAAKVLRVYQRPIAAFVHSQMLDHFVEEHVEYEVVVRQGLTDIKESAFTAAADEAPRALQEAPPSNSEITRSLYGGFARCLHDVTKFQSNPERILAIILERESQKWFRPARGQFQLFYKLGHEQHEYQPDFVAETADAIYMLEPKQRKEMTSAEVLAKRDAGVLWCQRASDHNAKNGGKPWKYVGPIPHDEIAENMTLAKLAAHFARSIIT
jgi:type III restriction enzyme